MAYKHVLCKGTSMIWEGKRLFCYWAILAGKICETYLKTLLFVLFYLVMVVEQKLHTFSAFMVFLWSGFQWERSSLRFWEDVWCLVISWVTGSRSNNLKQPHSKSVRLRHHRVARWSRLGFYFLECRLLVLKLNAVRLGYFYYTRRWISFRVQWHSMASSTKTHNTGHYTTHKDT